jgi:hypothetical protein
MPVTARLSKAFYDQFGEQVTNELVEWFNLVDLTYHTELRTLNDTNFARFEALLDSRFARADLQLERQLNERFGEFEHRMEKRIDAGDQRSRSFEQRIEQRLGEFEQRSAAFEQRIEKRLGEFEQRTVAFEERIEKRFVEIEHRLLGIETGFRLLSEDLRRGQVQQLRWIAGLWMTTMIGLFAMLAMLIRQG